MLFQRMGPRPASVSDAVYFELMRTLHRTLVPVMLSGSAQAIAGVLIIQRTGDVVVTGALSGLGVLIAMIRGFGVLSFRRRIQKQPFDGAEVRRRGRRYITFSFAAAFVVGLLIARSLVLEDPLCIIATVGIGFGFGNGVIARLSLMPVAAGLNLALIALPAMAVCLWRMDSPHLLLALMIGIYFVDNFEMVRRTFNSTLNHILLKQKFEQASRLDPMTGLLNRSVLDTDLPRLLASEDNDKVAIYALDLDHFKEANDRFGHPVGDALLRQVAARLRAAVGASGLIIRMGGDEFVLAEPVHSREEVASFAQCLVDTVRAPYRIDGHDIVIGASVGIALSPDHGLSADGLLCRADLALYFAKATRGTYAFADDPAIAKSATTEAATQQRAA